MHGKDRGGLTVGFERAFRAAGIHEGLLDVNPYLGWFGPFSRVVQAGSLVGAGAFKLPGARSLVGAATDRFVKGSTGGPTPEERAAGGSHVVGAAYDASGKQLSEVHLAGVDGYSFTGEILARGAERAAAGALRGVGALGPSTGSASTSSRPAAARQGSSAPSAADVPPASDAQVRRRRLALGVVAGLAVLVGIVVGAGAGDDDAAKSGGGPASNAAAQPPLPLATAVGQVLMIAFDGTEPPAWVRRWLGRDQAAGVTCSAATRPTRPRRSG